MIDQNKVVDYKKLNYYNYEIYYITTTNRTTFELKIYPLITSSQNQNRICPIITNNIGDYPYPVLKVKENEPVFLYFNDKFKKITLRYIFEKSNNENPVIVSFFIKEKIKFKIEISDNTKKIIKRTINYKENIIIKPESAESDNTYNIFITPEEGIINSTMIVKFVQNNLSPIYLQKNQFNLGFFPIGLDYYYYYMEVFKGEEGEIILFNKRRNGILISKIIEKNNYAVPTLDKFPKYNANNILSNDYSEFKIYFQKLTFNVSHLDKCEKGCFLLITYYYGISKPLDIIGTEFSILSRTRVEQESISQIISIPLNEYIWLY